MRLITITLKVETVEELVEKSNKFRRNAKIAIVLYNILYVVKISVEWIVEN